MRRRKSVSDRLKCILVLLTVTAIAASCTGGRTFTIEPGQKYLLVAGGKA